jgi:acyl dehydratase
MNERYLDDDAAGQKFGSLRIRVEKDRIKAFAAEFGPQPFHFDEAPALDRIFRGLAASDWHTAAMTMRLRVGLRAEAGGRHRRQGFDEFRWPRPVRRRAPSRMRDPGSSAVKIPDRSGTRRR